jgi:hypothetical protein
MRIGVASPADGGHPFKQGDTGLTDELTFSRCRHRILAAGVTAFAVTGGFW